MTEKINDGDITENIPTMDDNPRFKQNQVKRFEIQNFEIPFRRKIYKVQLLKLEFRHYL